MGGITTTFAVTTSLSVLLHGALVVGWLSMVEPSSATGKGIELQLIRSYQEAEQSVLDSQQPVNSEAVAKGLKPEQKREPSKLARADSKLVNSKPAKANLEKAERGTINTNSVALNKPIEQGDDRSTKVISIIASPMTIAAVDKQSLSVDGVGKLHSQDALQKSSSQKRAMETVKPFQPALSTNALPQQHSMLQLLHVSISRNKEYPYIAQRQRREGVAKIGFVLNPDGSIDNTRLLMSSRANVLDRAALAAVRAIEPFKPARHYLEQAEAFEIDVVFQLL